MSNTLKPPGVFKRFAIIIYDALLLLAVLFLATLVLLPFQTGNIFEPNSWQFSLYLLLVSFVFYSWFWTRSGQTLGLLSWKLRVVSQDGENISWKQAATRFSVAIFSWGICGLGFFWILFNKDRLTWHDMASNSHLVWKEKT